jgi:hypothetical protein
MLADPWHREVHDTPMRHNSVWDSRPIFVAAAAQTE